MLKDRGKTVRDLMTPNPECVTESDSLRDAARKMKSEDIGAIPVIQSEGGRKIIGMVTDRDIVTRVVADGRNPDECTVRDAMTKEVFSVREDDSIERVHQVMRERQVRRVPVVDQREELVGIVAQADIATENNDKRVGETVERISERSR